MSVKHPAKYHPAILALLSELVAEERARLGREPAILDPFAGLGKVHELGSNTLGIEIEQEWAMADPMARTVWGDCLLIMASLHNQGYWADIVATSPAYGNRLADGLRPVGSKWRGTDVTYANSLGRKLSPGNGASLKWGGTYKALHLTAWMLAADLIPEGGLFLLNVKDHYRDKRRQHVVAWHLWAVQNALGALPGFDLEGVYLLKTGGVGRGANTQRTAALPEYVLALRRRAC